MARQQQTAFNFTATGQFSPWLKHDVNETPFNVSLAVYFGTGLAGTLGVQQVVDDGSQAASRLVFLTQAVNTITVTDSGPTLPGGPFGHGLLVGDYVNLSAVGFNLPGDYNVATVVSANQYTLTSALSQTVPQQGAQVVSGRVTAHATLVTLTARATGVYQSPVWMSRLTSSGAITVAGVAYLVALQGAVSS